MSQSTKDLLYQWQNVRNLCFSLIIFKINYNASQHPLSSENLPSKIKTCKDKTDFKGPLYGAVKSLSLCFGKWLLQHAVR